MESATDELPAAMAVVSADVGDDVDDVDVDAEEDSPAPTRPPPRWRLCRAEGGDGQLLSDVGCMLDGMLHES